MKALILAQHDAAQGKLSQEKQLQIRDTVEDVVDAMKNIAIIRQLKKQCWLTTLAPTY